MLVHADGTRCDKPNKDPYKLLSQSAFPNQTYFCGHDRLVYTTAEKPTEQL